VILAFTKKGLSMPKNQTAKTTAVIYTDPRPLVERSIAEEAGTKRVLRSVTVNIAESPLAWLHSRGHLNDRQLLAGEKLRYDYEAASLGPQITMRWDVVPMRRTRRSAPSPMAANERVLSAKDRFDSAIATVGPDLADIAWRVICAGEGVPFAEKAMGWPVRSGKLVLRIALDRLADFYRVPG
jgi:Domain of unknown function (DUF6456)